MRQGTGIPQSTLNRTSTGLQPAQPCFFSSIQPQNCPELIRSCLEAGRLSSGDLPHLATASSALPDLRFRALPVLLCRRAALPGRRAAQRQNTAPAVYAARLVTDQGSRILTAFSLPHRPAVRRRPDAPGDGALVSGPPIRSSYQALDTVSFCPSKLAGRLSSGDLPRLATANPLSSRCFGDQAYAYIEQFFIPRLQAGCPAATCRAWRRRPQSPPPSATAPSTAACGRTPLPPALASTAACRWVRVQPTWGDAGANEPGLVWEWDLGFRAPGWRRRQSTSGSACCAPRSPALLTVNTAAPPGQSVVPTLQHSLGFKVVDRQRPCEQPR